MGRLRHGGEIEDLPDVPRAVATIKPPVPAHVVVRCIPTRLRERATHANVSGTMRPGVVGIEVQRAPEPIGCAQQKTMIVRGALESYAVRYPIS
jgi:hypothetical protein